VDLIAVYEERDPARGPLCGVEMVFPRVEWKCHPSEVIDDARIAERVDADPHRCRAPLNLPPKDLADADLRRSVGLVLVADHPERDDHAWDPAPHGAKPHPPVLR